MRKIVVFLVVAVYFYLLPVSANCSPELRSLQSAGKTIALEWYAPEKSEKSKRSEKFGVVLILHGSGGMPENGGFQRAISHNGRIAAILHYMDQTGLKSSDSKDMGKYFGTWLSTISTTISFLEKVPSVDTHKISLLGHSLGAQLSLQTAA
jgi:pimeloyl-ACP methyl ester carboxylesterase